MDPRYPQPGGPTREATMTNSKRLKNCAFLRLSPRMQDLHLPEIICQRSKARLVEMFRRQLHKYLQKRAPATISMMTQLQSAVLVNWIRNE